MARKFYNEDDYNAEFSQPEIAGTAPGCLLILLVFLITAAACHFLF